MASSYSVFKAKFKKTIADAIYKEITSKTARYYHWFGKENSWQDFLSPFIPANPTTDAPGEPSDNFRYDLHVRRDILTTKLIKPSDVSFVVRRIDWENDTVYDMYDDAYDKVSGFGYGPAYSGATRLEEANFYVLTSEYNVYKCIWNAEDTPSTVMPTGTTVDTFTTSDGYKWKFMYTIPVGLRNRFLTSEYMPVTTALNTQYYANGAIEKIIIENGGSGYNPSTTVASITGDGYIEKNPYKLSDVVLQKTTNTGIVSNTGGYGYTTVPAITISSPYPTSTAWSSSKSVAVGSYVSHYNPLADKTNFYKVITGTQLGTSGPTHDDPDNPTLNNGLAQLKYVGTQAVAVATLDTTLASPTYSTITAVIFDGGVVGQGYGYLGAPTITIEPPVTGDSAWAISATVEENDIIKYEDRYYTVTSNTVGQTLGTTPPTHTSGTVTNGTADLEYIAKDANVELIVTKNEATISLIITEGTDSVFTINMSSTNPGFQYAEPPTITVSAPPVGATATAEIASTAVVDGSIITVEVTNPGNGYLTTPTVTVAPPSITIDPTDPAVIDSSKITYNSHKLLQNDIVTYSEGAGTEIGGLVNDSAITAGSFVSGSTYKISTLGTTNWISIGAEGSYIVGSVSGTTLTITDIAEGSPTLAAGTYLSGAGIIAGTNIVTQLTSTEIGSVLGGKGTYQLSGTNTVSTTETLSGVAIDGTAGQFTCTASTTPLIIGQTVTVSGTDSGTGDIDGYTNPKTYYIIATNGSTTFTLSAISGGTALTTTAGSTTGLTFTKKSIITVQPKVGAVFEASGVGAGTGTAQTAYYVVYIDQNNFKLAANFDDADALIPVTITLDESLATGTAHKFTLRKDNAAAVATANLGSGGEIIGYTIEDGGIGYTNCNITITDTSDATFDGGAVLVADFGVGDVDTVQANVELLAVPGSIEAIKIVDGGSGYGGATVTILGDGTGATARAVCTGGSVTAIEMVTTGQGYTWTDVVIIGNVGSTGAVARAIMSPLGGHGADAIDELNANSIVFYSSISRDKNQGIEIVNNDYRKAGLVRNIKQYGSNVRFTDDVGSGCVLISGFTLGNPDENIDVTALESDMLLYKDETPDDPSLTTDDLDYKKYRIVEYNENQILLSVFNNFTIKEGDILRTDPSNIGRKPVADRLPRTRIKVTQVSERTIDQFSGDFLFFSVRESYQPTEDQIITIRTTLTL